MMIAICYILSQSVIHYLWLAICYLVLEYFFLNLAITCKNLLLLLVDVRLCTVYSGTELSTVLFIHVVESWNCTNTRNLWLGTPEPLPKTCISTNERPRKIYTRTNIHKSELYNEVAIANNVGCRAQLSSSIRKSRFIHNWTSSWPDCSL